MGSTSADLQGVDRPTLDAETSVKGQLAVIDSLTPAKSGSYFNYEGDEISF